MSSDRLSNSERLTRLRALYARWSAEYRQIRAADASRAVHHAEALADLRTILERLERANSTHHGERASSYATPDA
jgi:hypothetical protein